jgi:hypothetical protein
MTTRILMVADHLELGAHSWLRVTREGLAEVAR